MKHKTRLNDDDYYRNGAVSDLVNQGLSQWN